MQWSRWAMVFLLALAASGCLVDGAHNGQPADGVVRVACLGDSNTWPFEYFTSPPFPPHDRWCEKLETLLTTPPLPTTFPANTSAETRNYGMGGATVCTWWPPSLPWGNGLFQAEQAFAEQADMVVAAFGTNDLRFGFTPQQVVECYQAIHDAAATNGTLMLVALTPPVYPPMPDPAALNAQIDTLNTLLRARFQSFEILDFHDGFTSDLFIADGLHLSDAGQDLRAARAYAQARYPY